MLIERWANAELLSKLSTNRVVCNVQENPWVKSRLSADKSKAPWHSSDINI